MSKQKPEGVCHICGRYGALSFEHVPPRAAFNNYPVKVGRFEDAINLGPDDEPTAGHIQQQGMGSYTLCAKCNNNTGSWYGKQFLDWCEQGLMMLSRTGG